MFNEFMARTFLETLKYRLANNRLDSNITAILKDLHDKWSKITGIEDVGIFIAALREAMKDDFARAKPSVGVEVAIRATSDGGFTIEEEVNGVYIAYSVTASVSGNRFIVVEK